MTIVPVVSPTILVVAGRLDTLRVILLPIPAHPATAPHSSEALPLIAREVTCWRIPAASATEPTDAHILGALLGIPLLVLCEEGMKRIPPADTGESVVPTSLCSTRATPSLPAPITPHGICARLPTSIAISVATLPRMAIALASIAATMLPLASLERPTVALIIQLVPPTTA